MSLYNGTDIELSEITVRICARGFFDKKKEEVRIYRTSVNIQPFAVADVPIRVVTDGTPPIQVVFLSAKGIRRGSVTPPRSGS